jgi:hypothetical protein
LTYKLWGRPWRTRANQPGRPAIFILLLLALCCSLPAAPPNPTGQVLRVPVWADANQDPPLSAKDLGATVDGTASRVVDVKGPADNLMLIAVLDLAGDLSLAEPAKEALASEIEQVAAARWPSV